MIQFMKRLAAFSLVEIMVAVGLLGVIIVGLMAMFNQTQRAFRSGAHHNDVMEGGRSASDLIKRDLIELAPKGSGTNLAAITNGTNVLFIRSRANSDEWRETGYFVASNTLYRFSDDSTNYHRILEGVTEFRVTPYDRSGSLDTGFMSADGFAYTNESVPGFVGIELVASNRASGAVLFQQQVAILNTQ